MENLKEEACLEKTKMKISSSSPVDCSIPVLHDETSNLMLQDQRHVSCSIDPNRGTVLIVKRLSKTAHGESYRPSVI
jgi:hypothetical protein